MNGEQDGLEAKQYSKIKTRLFFMDMAGTIIALLVFSFFLAPVVSDIVYRYISHFYAARFIFLSVFFLFLYIIQFPFHIAGSFFVEHKFGLSKQDMGGWIRDELKAIAISYILSSGCILTFYAIVRNFPDIWWVISGIGWIFFSIIISRLFPVIVIPMFFKYSPIQDKELEDKIMVLAEKADIPVTDVCKIDLSRKTVKANAALVGLGATRKVVFADTLIEKFTVMESGIVAAHEFGHCKYKHIWKLFFFAGSATMSGFFALAIISDTLTKYFGAKDVADPRFLAVIFLLVTIFGICLKPIRNLFSRILEKEADKFALDLTNSSSDFISVMEKLASINLAETNPSWIKKIFFYDHPPIVERIRMAKKFKR
ncbi:MAG: M48 family metallopeptidase [Candidatus Omnitrophica bacterium]|nr:M48 family metallopeptidase [Candidatus Omnitrophota bacterium]